MKLFVIKNPIADNRVGNPIAADTVDAVQLIHLMRCVQYLRCRPVDVYLYPPAKEWNSLPASVFPNEYNPNLFKVRVNRLLLGRRYLETCIIYAKGSTEKAKKKLDKLCTLKTLLPTFFEKCNIKDLADTTGVILHATMPQLLKNNYRLYVVKLVSSDLDQALLMEFNRFIILMSEYVKICDYSFGFTVVIDCRDVNILSFASKVNILDLRNSMSVLMEGYGLRINAIYVISASKTIDVFVTLLKQVLSNKIGGRINVIKTIEELHERVPKEILPKEYGGQEKTLKEVHENWRKELSRPENVEYFKEMSQAKTDEKYRQTDKYNEQVLGMPGSFRSLTVD